MSLQHIDILGLFPEELAEQLKVLGHRPFRARQLWQWIYRRGETDFEKMSSLSKGFRLQLKEHFTVSRPEVLTADSAEDETRKWLFGFADNKSVETVHIPEADRGALCVSTQVGCAMGCTFCNTGTQPFVRDLSAAEILGQYMAARDDRGQWNLDPEAPRFLSNVVLMGMGEPLLNYDNVVRAVRIMMHPEGLSISRRRITLSTCGIVPRIEDCARDLGVKLAVSLHAPTDDMRRELMPVARKYPLSEVMAACRAYQKIVGARQYITMEYLLLGGVNDSPADARECVRLVSGLGVKFNLIPFNKWPGAPFDPPGEKRVRAFADVLAKAGIAAPVRVPRGQDIRAACGQLKTDSAREKSL